MGSKFSFLKKSTNEVQNKEQQTFGEPHTEKVVHKCECIECKCDPCFCTDKGKPMEQINEQLKTLTIEPTEQQSKDQIEDKVEPVPKENVLIDNTVVNEDNEKVMVTQTEDKTIEQTKPEEPKTETTEKKCLCNPCECVDCKCGQHDQNQQSPESEVSQTPPVIEEKQTETHESQPQSQEHEDQVKPESEQENQTQPEVETKVPEGQQQEPEAQETDKTESNEEINVLPTQSPDHLPEIVETPQEFNQELQSQQQ